MLLREIDAWDAFRYAGSANNPRFLWNNDIVARHFATEHDVQCWVNQQRSCPISGQGDVFTPRPRHQIHRPVAIPGTPGSGPFEGPSHTDGYHIAEESLPTSPTLSRHNTGRQRLFTASQQPVLFSPVGAGHATQPTPSSAHLSSTPSATPFPSYSGGTATESLLGAQSSHHPVTPPRSTLPKANYPPELRPGGSGSVPAIQPSIYNAVVKDEEKRKVFASMFAMEQMEKKFEALDIAPPSSSQGTVIPSEPPLASPRQVRFDGQSFRAPVAPMGPVQVQSSTLKQPSAIFDFAQPVSGVDSPASATMDVFGVTTAEQQPRAMKKPRRLTSGDSLDRPI
jgi:hypothetical protein